MEIMEITKKQKQEYERAKRIENLKRRWTLLKSKLLNKKISPDDTRTIQAHKDSEGVLRDYYIANAYLQDEASFKAVNPVIEDEENSRFVYRGILGSTNNTIGIIESNVPISEIISNPEGNTLFHKMISGENATKVRDAYYTKIGEPISPLKGHSSFFGKPEFPLGTILRIKNNEFKLCDDVSYDVEKIIEEERELTRLSEKLREDDSVEIDIGDGMVVAKQDCWLEQRNGIEFTGVNKDALYYKYSPQNPIKTDDNKFVYIGNLEIGRVKTLDKKDIKPIKFIKPFTYKDIALWTDSKNLLQYFLEDKLNGLNFSLGSIFTTGNIEKMSKGNSKLIIGGITKDSDECKSVYNLPDSVVKAVEEYHNKSAQKSNNIISFDDPRR